MTSAGGSSPMDQGQPADNGAGSGPRSPKKPGAKKPGGRAAKKAPPKVAPPAPTADFPAPAPEPVPAEVAEPASAVPAVPAVPAEIVKETAPEQAPAADLADGDDDAQSADPAGRHRADETPPAGTPVSDAELVSLVQTPMRTPQPSRAPAVIGALVLLLLLRRRRRRRARKRAAAG